MRFNRVCLLLGLFATGAFAEQPIVEIFIPDAMPLVASHDPMGHGLMGDVALEALKRAGYRVTIKTEPWLRAQKRVREGHNLMLVPLSRTPEREDKYTWVASVLPLARAFFTFDEPVQTFEQARTRYQRIGVSIGTAQEEILRANGFQSEQIYSLQLGDHPLKLLELNRIDAWFTTVPEGQYHWARSSSRPLMKSPEMATTDLYVACSKSCDADLVQAVRSAAEKMRADGSMAHIIDRYLKPAPPPKEK
jgi:polar amino acid transport system substrate-binding protein